MKVHTSLPLIAVFAAGCGYTWAREVRRVPNGGELALTHQESHASVAAAHRIMAGRCPDGYAILEEGEFVVGSSTTTQSTRVLGAIDLSTASSSNLTEWRLRYVCTAPSTPQQPLSSAVAPSSNPGNSGSATTARN